MGPLRGPGSEEEGRQDSALKVLKVLRFDGPLRPEGCGSGF